VRRSKFLLEHYPAPGKELGAVVPAGVGAAPPPRVADGTEADVVGYVVGEDALGENPRRPGREIRPVPPVTTRIRTQKMSNS
jgi:hypothetical protein